jgi:lysophospholipase L1-like esterase
MTRTVLALLLSLATIGPAWAQAVAADPAQWEADIAAFEASDRSSAPSKGGIVFTGSSSIRLWTTLVTDFPGLPVINRGFGGSKVPEVTAFVRRIVTVHRPRMVVIYCGGNDLNAGRTPAEVVADTQALVRAIHADLPSAHVAYISLAPNPARWAQIGAVQEVNAAIARWIAGDSRMTFIDVYRHMLGPDGQPKADIFVDDRLHMNEKGYAIWREVVGPYLR